MTTEPTKTDRATTPKDLALKPAKAEDVKGGLIDLILRRLGGGPDKPSGGGGVRG